MPLISPQKWEFLTKNDPLQRLLRTHQACTMAPTACLMYLVCVIGPIVPDELLQYEIASTSLVMYAKSGHRIPLRH